MCHTLSIPCVHAASFENLDWVAKMRNNGTLLGWKRREHTPQQLATNKTRLLCTVKIPIFWTQATYAEHHSIKHVSRCYLCLQFNLLNLFASISRWCGYVSSITCHILVVDGSIPSGCMLFCSMLIFSAGVYRNLRPL